MRIMIMDCSKKSLWYKDKISCRYDVMSVNKEGDYKTKDGMILKCDVVIISK